MHKQLKKMDFFLIIIQFIVFDNCWGAAMDPLAGRVFEVPEVEKISTVFKSFSQQSKSLDRERDISILSRQQYSN
jgi:hypothetical protein